MSFETENDKQKDLIAIEKNNACAPFFAEDWQSCFQICHCGLLSGIIPIYIGKISIPEAQWK